uniref:Uncharacterized protein n=1 Tax=Arundo donax TaxID=35708 RepID=A0A0A9EMG3_ARUDO
MMPLRLKQAPCCRSADTCQLSSADSIKQSRLSRSQVATHFHLFRFLALINLDSSLYF